ncbi:MAG: hypothetical protein MH219_19535 [Marinobacter sp.]|nr:hypothetical protein [Marinobacter sp.]
MTNVYHDTAYRSDAIPALPSGGHPDMDKAFQRLPWGRCQNPIVPNTMAVQLAYAGLFEDDSDADDGFPWGESVFSVSKGFLSGLQGFLYMVYMCAAVVFFISFLPLGALILKILFTEPSAKGFLWVYDTVKFIYAPVFIGYFGGKYGRLLLAHLTDKLQRANPTGLYRREGVVRIKERKSVFEAPFIEFDAYLIHTPVRPRRSLFQSCPSAPLQQTPVMDEGPGHRRHESKRRVRLLGYGPAVHGREWPFTRCTYLRTLSFKRSGHSGMGRTYRSRSFQMAEGHLRFLAEEP